MRHLVLMSARVYYWRHGQNAACYDGLIQRQGRRCCFRSATVGTLSVNSSTERAEPVIERQALKSLGRSDLADYLCENGLEKSAEYTSQAIFRHMYQAHVKHTELHRMWQEDPKIRKDVVHFLQGNADVDGGLSLLDIKRARDGTTKLVFSCRDSQSNNAAVETVLIPMLSGPQRKERLTICVSSQVGCAQNCQFCFTGRMGLVQQLSTDQIVEQIVVAQRYLQENNIEAKIGNIVFMGMGEPLHNMDSVKAACEIMCDQMGLNFSAKKIAVSTVGLVPQIRDFMAKSKVQLAVSLHATTDEVRDWLVPVNKRYNLEMLIGTLEELFPASGSEIVMIECVSKFCEIKSVPAVFLYAEIV